MKKNSLLLAAALLLSSGSAMALNITVAPSTGGVGLNPSNSIADAIAQINAGPDATNTITLRSTEGVHSLADNVNLSITGGKSVDFVAETGRPIVKLNWAAGQYMCIVTGSAGSTITFTGLGFIPEVDLGYVSNVADGFSLAGTGVIGFSFNDCIFAANNGADGLSSLDGSATFTQPTGTTSPAVGGRNVGDDWLQLNASGAALTISNCVLTGCNDDAIISLGGAGSVITINQGTVVANVGGAGYQNAADNETINIDGTAGRVLFAKCGLRSAFSPAADTGPKCFGDVGVSFTMTKTDVVDATNGGFFDFGGVPNITISDCRIAMNNSSNTSTAGNIAISDIANDSGTTNQIINLSRVTIHDSLATSNVDAIFANEQATGPAQTFTVIDSIFSGAGDSFANMTNSIASGGASPAPVVTTSAIVQAGTHAIATVGDLASATTPLTTDPNYASLTYTIGRSQDNPDFLRPQDAAYLTASSTSGIIGGISPAASQADWFIY